MFEVENGGSIFLFRPMTDSAVEHAAEVFADAQWFGGAVVVEHGFAQDTVERLRADGFEVK